MKNSLRRRRTLKNTAEQMERLADEYEQQGDHEGAKQEREAAARNRAKLKELSDKNPIL